MVLASITLAKRGEFAGDRFEGEHKNGKANGFGKHYYSLEREKFAGDRFEGEYKDDVRHGKGTYFSKAGISDNGKLH